MTSTTFDGARGYHRLALINSLTKAIADRLLLATIVGLGLAAMSLVMAPMFVALEESLAEMLDSIPESVMAMAGGVDMATPAGWYTGEMYSIVVPFAVILVAIISSARAFGGEVEARTIGLIMSTPTRRSRLAAHKLVAMVVHVTLAAGLTALGTWIGVAVMGLDLSLGGIVAITFMLALLSVAAGSLAMLVSVATGRGNLAILITALVAVAAYAWSSFVPLADPIADLAWLSPWHHYIGTDPISDGVDLLSAAWLAILAAVPMVLGVRVFRRRDIPA